MVPSTSMLRTDGIKRNGFVLVPSFPSKSLTKLDFDTLTFLGNHPRSNVHETTALTHGQHVGTHTFMTHTYEDALMCDQSSRIFTLRFLPPQLKHSFVVFADSQASLVFLSMGVFIYHHYKTLVLSNKLKNKEV